jgi:hypothetical protein
MIQLTPQITFMKNKFRLAQLSVILFFVFFLLSIESCTKTGKCEEVPDLSNSGIQVDFKDNATVKYLYTTSNPLYNIDSLKIYDENNLRMSILMHVNNIPNSPAGYWSNQFWKHL